MRRPIAKYSVVVIDTYFFIKGLNVVFIICVNMIN